MAQHLTPALINRHLMPGIEPATNPVVRTQGEQLLLDFEGRCLVTIGRGGSFFTEADYQQAHTGLFATILGEEILTPKIGRRAHIAGIEQDIAIFSSSDGRFDVRIEPQGTPQPVDVVGAAVELSKLYDQRANHALQRTRESAVPIGAPRAPGR